MNRGVLVRLVLVIGLLAGCAAIALNVAPRLGLDLRGGSQIVIQVLPGEDGEEPTASDVDQVVEVLRGRVDSLGVSEPTLVRQGTDQILVELPDVQNPEEAEQVLGQQAQLSIHEVTGAAATPDAEPTEEGNEVVTSDQGDVIEIGPTVIRGTEIDGSDAVNDPTQGGGWVVNVDFDGQGGRTWEEITARAACADGVTPTPQTDPTRRVAIVLDETVISSPPMAASVGCAGIGGGSTQISGDFDFEEAENLSVLIEGGSLPFPVEDVSTLQTGPTLGADAIQASAEAAIIGLALTALFIGFVYRLVGILATLALTSYALISYAILVTIGSTLTLPGLAGFVLAIGMAIDANVLVFERAREEYRDNPNAGMLRALKIGFNKAWSAIIDTNVTTLIAAALLYFLASGPVRGFGVTLAIGVVASMISALVIARVLTELGVSVPFVRRRPAITGLGDVGRVRTWLMRKNFQIMARMKIWLGISAALVVVALAGVVVNNLNLGVEFTGGRTIEYSTSQALDADQAREVVADAGYPEATVQSVQGDNISVRAGSLDQGDQDAITAALSDAAGGAEVVQSSDVGASLGEQLRNNAIIAFGLAFLGQLVYLAIRYKWTFGLSAIIAMAHDVVIVVGLFAWLGKPIDGVFLAAIMTIIGVSVNDTVVVFDRIRERWRLSRPEATFSDEANTACLETTPRTINTGIGIMFILAALVFLGGSSLGDFAIALLVGLVVGTYSSVFVATPLTILFSRISPMTRAQKVRKERDLQDSGAVV